MTLTPPRDGVIFQAIQADPREGPGFAVDVRKRSEKWDLWKGAFKPVVEKRISLRKKYWC